MSGQARFNEPGARAPAGSGPATNTGSTQQSTQNLNQIVTDYLIKRGFHRTEEVFRKESSNLGVDGRPQHKTVQDMGPTRYAKAFSLLKKFVDDSLDFFKFELNKFQWPIFVHSYLTLVGNKCSDEAKAFLDEFKGDFQHAHADDLKLLATITLPEHIDANEVAHRFKTVKYRILVTNKAFDLVVGHMDKEAANGGDLIMDLLNAHTKIEAVDRGVAHPYSFSALWEKDKSGLIDQTEIEGVPGAFEGTRTDKVLSAPLKLGPFPMDPDLQGELRSEVTMEDQRNPPAEGKPGLLEEFEHKIKREESTDGPTRAELPLPAPRIRDVLNEVEKLKEHRDRFRIEGRTGGVGPGVSVCTFTFHNSLGNFNCIEFSNDQKMIAVGTMDSYIRVWSMDGSHLASVLERGEIKKPTNNRMLIGHSGPVMSISFSDAVNWPEYRETGHNGRAPPLLLSSSSDGTIRLWNLDTWLCLCAFKGHSGPVWKVQWGPHGHYFASAGRDKVLRIWAQDRITSIRDCVGHNDSVSAIAWHPNGAYVFSASDQTDKSIRMWSVVTGDCVRVLAGHADDISALECAPNGKILASADWAGNILFWDLEKGTLIKRSRGHAKTGIMSISFSVESSVLVSGGLDGTVRVWDVELPADGAKTTAAPSPAEQGVQLQTNTAISGDTIMVGGGPQQPAPVAPTTASAAAGSSTNAGASGAGGSKKKGKEAQVTADQISAFPTKKTPLKKVKFTRMNLVIASGCFDPGA
ncbi:unnamed protein product [Discula destructiva]